jgi:hypothetical protein
VVVEAAVEAGLDVLVVGGSNEAVDKALKQFESQKDTVNNSIKASVLKAKKLEGKALSGGHASVVTFEHLDHRRRRRHKPSPFCHERPLKLLVPVPSPILRASCQIKLLVKAAEFSNLKGFPAGLVARYCASSIIPGRCSAGPGFPPRHMAITR